MPLTLERFATARLPESLPEGPLARALEELARITSGLTGTGPPLDLRLEESAGVADGFVVRVTADAIVIRGNGGRGVLNGAYWLLERLGYTWVAPGPKGERFTPGRAVAEGTYEEAPAFAKRTLILGQDALHDDWREWLEWASRNRLNDIFFHDTPPSRLARDGASRPGDAEGMAADGGGWMFERWAADGPEIVAAAKARGMTVQFGGHHLPALVSRNLFDEHPDWFPLREGIRNRRYNLCVSNRQAMAHLRREARGFFERFAGADVYHLWADDIRGGGWCECEGCARWSPSEQALIATNAVAEVLDESAPAAALSHLAYHDTLARPAGIAPASNVHVLWAPRERCYAHPIADPSCERNRSQYWGRFNELQSTVNNEAGRLDVFEYYSDAILFKWLAPPLLSVLAADAKAYRDGGAGNLQTLMVGPRPWLGPPWHAWWLAQCAWNPDIDAGEALGRFCEAAYPGAANDMAAYYRGSEAAFQLVLERYDLRPIARHDVLDYADDPRDTLRRKAGELLAAEELFRALFESLPKGGDWLAREVEQAELQWHVVAHLAHRVGAWDASLGGDATAVERHRPEAIRHMEWLERWEAESNPATYANLSRGMLRAMRFHTSAIG